jgi:hypothetical protein
MLLLLWAGGRIEDVHLVDGHMGEIDERLYSMVLRDDGDVDSRFEIGRRDRHCEAETFAPFDRPMYRHKIEQIANHDFCTERAQPCGPLVVHTNLRPYPEPTGAKQLRHGAADRADPSSRPGHENRKFMLCLAHLSPHSE